MAKAKKKKPPGLPEIRGVLRDHVPPAPPSSAATQKPKKKRGMSLQLIPSRPTHQDWEADNFRVPAIKPGVPKPKHPLWKETYEPTLRYQPATKDRPGELKFGHKRPVTPGEHLQRRRRGKKGSL